MTIKEYINHATDILKAAEIDAPAIEAGVILCYILKCDKAYLYAHDDVELNEGQASLLSNILEQRAKNVPVQYLTGETEFMSLPFKVSPDVLIPRQDTEILVEKCIEVIGQISRTKRNAAIKNESIIYKNNMEKHTGADACTGSNQREVRVLDMCTGSGCIAVSIASYCSECMVVACDISQEALEVAKINSKLNLVKNRLEFCCGNLFEALKDNQKFDLIVSNPPYIETKTITELQKEVRNYEPHLALDGGRDGLDFYRSITALAPAHLFPGGYLAFEIGYNQAESVSELMHKDFETIEIIKDLGRNDRVVIGRLQSFHNLSIPES